MTQKINVSRPAVVDEFKEAKRQSERWTTKADKLRLEVIELFKKGLKCQDVKMSTTPARLQIDNKKAMEWAKANLSEKQYKECLCLSFDPDAFVGLIESLPKGKFAEIKAELKKKGVFYKSKPSYTVRVYDK